MYRIHTNSYRQSPIDIRPHEAIYDMNLDENTFQFEYDPADNLQLVNTGTTWQVSCKQDSKSILRAGHLPGDYRLVQFHGHWGTNPWNGSEHQILSKGYAGEVHLVHHNTKYQNFAAATEHSDGIAVLGVFLDETQTDNLSLIPLIRGMSEISEAKQAVQLKDGFDLISIVPKNRQFWSYEGSLTTPPYTECVLWTVFKNPVSVSSKQLQTLRFLYHRNVRPVQPLNGRVPRSSFVLGGRCT